MQDPVEVEKHLKGRRFTSAKLVWEEQQRKAASGDASESSSAGGASDDDEDEVGAPCEGSCKHGICFMMLACAWQDDSDSGSVASDLLFSSDDDGEMDPRVKAVVATLPQKPPKKRPTPGPLRASGTAKLPAASAESDAVTTKPAKAVQKRKSSDEAAKFKQKLAQKSKKQAK
jgi:hypothetical protein